MAKFLVDENIEQYVLDGLRMRVPTVDAVSVGEVGLQATDDRTILQWAAKEERVVVSHDVNTMKPYAEDRVAAGLPMPGLLLALPNIPIRRIIETLVDIELYSLEGEWDSRVEYVSGST